MIGWRVGWVVGPPALMADVSLVGMTNVVCQVGIAQQAVAAALSAPDAAADVAAATAVWQERAETVLEQLGRSISGSCLPTSPSSGYAICGPGSMPPSVEPPAGSPRRNATSKALTMSGNSSGSR